MGGGLLQQGLGLFGRAAPFRLRVFEAGQVEQVVALGGGEAQRFGQPGQGGRGHGLGAALFYPGQPGGADIAQGGHFFAAQAFGAAALAGRQAGLFRLSRSRWARMN